ncbi:hypothetical protein B0H11DRAFT_2306939 [Mycena galericulata]|nr:hypothetical protein B0H11DRAFT_2306939 [Mycena galericulata]
MMRDERRDAGSSDSVLGPSLGWPGANRPPPPQNRARHTTTRKIGFRSASREKLQGCDMRLVTYSRTCQPTMNKQINRVAYPYLSSPLPRQRVPPRGKSSALGRATRMVPSPPASAARTEHLAHFSHNLAPLRTDRLGTYLAARPPSPAASAVRPRSSSLHAWGGSTLHGQAFLVRPLALTSPVEIITGRMEKDGGEGRKWKVDGREKETEKERR